MIDIRYHVISLVAVLLALGIGILLGTTLVERGLIAEQKAEIESLKKTFDEIRDRNKRLNSELKVYMDFASQAKDYLIPGRLSGKSFAVISVSGTGDAVLASTRDSISSAGGNVILNITLASVDIYESADVRNTLSGLFGMPDDASALKRRTLEEIANQVVAPTNPAIVSELERIGILDMSGMFPAPLSGCVLVSEREGVKKEDADAFEGELVRRFVARGFPVLGAGGEKTGGEILSVMKQSGASTVERAETIPGQVAIVLALEGRGGNYGRSGNAERLIPEPVQ